MKKANRSSCPPSRSLRPYASGTASSFPPLPERSRHRIHPMLCAHEREMEDEARAGIAHDLANLFLLCRRVAPHPALGAEGLRLHEGAARHTLLGIGQKLCALRAEAPLRRAMHSMEKSPTISRMTEASRSRLRSAASWLLALIRPHTPHVSLRAPLGSESSPRRARCGRARPPQGCLVPTAPFP